MASPVPWTEDAAGARADSGPAAPSSAATASTHLAPALPAPPADARLLVGALLLLAVAVVLVGLTAARLRPRRRPQPSPRSMIVAALEDLKCDAAGVGDRGADRVRLLLTRFLAGTTGRPCSAMTVPELAAGLADQPAARQAAVAALLRVLRECDRVRYGAVAPLAADSLVDEALAALRLWPEDQTHGSGPAAVEERA